MPIGHNRRCRGAVFGYGCECRCTGTASNTSRTSVCPADCAIRAVGTARLAHPGRRRRQAQAGGTVSGRFRFHLQHRAFPSSRLSIPIATHSHSRTRSHTQSSTRPLRSTFNRQRRTSRTLPILPLPSTSWPMTTYTGRARIPILILDLLPLSFLPFPLRLSSQQPFPRAGTALFPSAPPPSLDRFPDDEIDEADDEDDDEDAKLASPVADECDVRVFEEWGGGWPGGAADGGGGSGHFVGLVWEDGEVLDVQSRLNLNLNRMRCMLRLHVRFQ